MEFSSNEQSPDGKDGINLVDGVIGDSMGAFKDESGSNDVTKHDEIDHLPSSEVDAGAIEKSSLDQTNPGTLLDTAISNDELFKASDEGNDSNDNGKTEASSSSSKSNSNSNIEIKVETEITPSNGDATRSSDEPKNENTPLVEAEGKVEIADNDNIKKGSEPITENEINNETTASATPQITENEDQALGKTHKHLNHVKRLRETEDPTNFESTVSAADLNRQTHTIVLPSYSAWFSLDKVNQIEMESLPEYFNDVNKSKTPEVYMKCRNFMVNSYRINPNEYLSFTAVRRNLIGDAGSMLRIHKFLNKWGLINYQVNPETKPIPVNPPYTGNYTIDFDTPRGMFPFESYKPPTTFPDIEKLKKSLGSDLNNNNDDDDKNDNKNSSSKSKSNSNNNNNNNNNNSSSSRSNSADEFLSFDNPKDEPPLKKQKIAMPDINSGWSEIRIKRLIEAVSQFRNNWYSIAEYVNKSSDTLNLNPKTPEDCIIRFLQLPMEDKFLNENKHLLEPLKYLPNISFSPQDNPVMTVLAFLVKLVDVNVAAAASQRAISELDNQEIAKINKANANANANGNGNENENENEKDLNGLESLNDAAINIFGIVGARAHKFADFESRKMHKAMVNIVEKELQLVDGKLKKLDILERQYHYKEKELSKKADELLQERLGMFKYTNKASSRLISVVNLFENLIEGGENKINENSINKAKELLSQAKDILYKPPRKQMNILEEGGDEDKYNETNDDSVKPVSAESPMLYRYWSG
ncbi:Swi3 protein [Martiniozyma asiatica (nom. inval.)]|nr:Swi3 protein [Martiniozyma asiatica]